MGLQVSTGVKRVHKGFQEFTVVQKCLHGLPGSTGVYNGLREIYTGIQGFTRVYRGLQGCTGGLQGFTGVYKGLQEHTGT